MEKIKKNKGISWQCSPSVIGKASIAGITLVALVVTIVVLLILAGLTITYVVGDNSVFNQAAQAREKIDMVLSEAKIPKYADSKYNENEYLDEFIINRISNTEVLDDIIITDGYAFELDRSVPKIGEYLGKKTDLVFPDVSLEVSLATDKKNATIKITAKEEKNGINKIEIWQAGQKLEEYNYHNEKAEITKEYIARQNGKYIVKVYANLSVRRIAEVTGIWSLVSFEPNGNTEWKKSHSTKVLMQETEEKIVNAKYYWSDSVAEPTDDKFVNTFHSGDIITENSNTLTGTYYLWTMLETNAGTKAKWHSEGFNFDNEGPTVSLEAQPISEASFMLTATASDISGISSYKFYVDNKLVSTQNEPTYTWNGTEMAENIECYVIATDIVGNSSSATSSARTKLHTWNVWNVTTSGTRVLYTLTGSPEERTTSYSNTMGHWTSLSIRSFKDVVWISSTAFVARGWDSRGSMNTNVMPGFYYLDTRSDGYAYLGIAVEQISLSSDR